MKMPALLTAAPSKSERARRRLLEAAVRIFGDRGVEGATVREIARAAGQNVAAIAYYFGGKEQLYRAVMEGIAREIRHRLGDVLEKIAALRAEAEPSPAEAVRLLQKFFRAVYLRLLSRTEAIPLARLIAREQMRPTAGFAILYDEGFRHVHEALCFLVGTALGRDPKARETIVRTHTLMGQVYFFGMAREVIRRRLGWRDLEGRKAEWVADIVAEHVEVLLSGLAVRLKP